MREEMVAAEAACDACLKLERIRCELHQHENDHLEGALGAIPVGYGINAPYVAGANEACQCQNQDACNLLAQNPVLQNDHLHPIVLVVPPSPPSSAIHGAGVVTPTPEMR